MQSYFVEAIGSADEETIRKYVQEQLVVLDGKEVKWTPRIGQLAKVY